MQKITHAILFSLAALMILIGCTQSEKKEFSVQDTTAVSSITGKFIGRAAPITVDFLTLTPSIEDMKKAAVFSPAIDGTWTVNQTRAVFTPAKEYTPDLEFSLSIDIGKLAGEKSGEKGFTTNFIVQKATLDIDFSTPTISTTNENMFELNGTIITDLPVDIKKIKDVIQIAYSGTGKTPTVTFHDPEGTRYSFSITNIERMETQQNLDVFWDGSPVNIGISSSKSFTIPAKDVFEIMSFEYTQDKSITLHFSENLDTKQNLRGKIRFDPELSFTWSITGNTMEIFPKSSLWPETLLLFIHKNIANSSKKQLNTNSEYKILSGWENPALEFASEGTILPNANNTHIPITTKNIHGIVVEAFQIYDNNMLQFLQENELAATSYKSELQKVGEPVWRQKIDFEWNANMKNQLVTRALDISTLVKKFPSGMLQLRIGFLKSQSEFIPKYSAEDFSSLRFPNGFEIFGHTDEEEERDYYDPFYSFSYDYYQQRKNPAHPAFFLPRYNSYIVKEKNVLVSNIALSVKRDTSKNYYVTATDLLTAQPISNAEIEFFNYAQKKLAQGKTNDDGVLIQKIHEDDTVVFIRAKDTSSTSWLRLNTGELSTSHFLVDGEVAKKGVKGFMYGERGVWRAGDPIHLMFILQDQKKTIPADLPLSFTLEDPLGKIIDTQVISESLNGFYRIDTKTNPTHTTGKWRAYAKLGGNTWTMPVQIENIVPNKLAVTLTSQKDQLLPGENTLLLEGEWLHGAPAPGLSAEVSMRLVEANTRFKQFPDYAFNDIEKQIRHPKEIVWKGTLDENSRANVTIPINRNNTASGMVQALLQTNIYESSGAFSTENIVLPCSPYDRYIGIKLPASEKERNVLLTDKNHPVDIVAVNSHGEQTNKNVPVRLSVYKLEWKWWWSKDAYKSSGYNNRRTTTIISRQTAVIENGKGRLNFNIKYPDWGRYLIRVEDTQSGHSSSRIVYVDWPGWATRVSDRSSESSSMLTITADKKKYSVGEDAHISFTASEDSLALITVEKNGSIITQTQIKTKRGSNVYALPINADLAPNAYVHISLIQEYKQTKNSLPIRMYGIVPIFVEDPKTHLNPQIKTAAEFKPNSPCSVTISEASGTPMTYTVAVVDEGLLGLTAFKTKNPRDHFYKKEASQLASWDLFAQVLGAFTGKPETLLSVGGGDFSLNEGKTDDTRFKPIVRVLGPYELKKGKKETITFDMPEYIGAVRIMVVAGHETAYGIQEKTVPVKTPLMVHPTLPRSLGVNETIDMPVTIFNGTHKSATTTVTLQTTGALTTQNTKKITVPAQSNSLVLFTLAPKEQGNIEINLHAQARGITETAVSTTTIDVMSRGSPFNEEKRVHLAAGETKTLTVSSPGDAGSRHLIIEASKKPSIGLEKRLSYLLDYPHGCIEQITSKAFPQLYIPHMVFLTQGDIQQVKNQVTEVLTRYSNYQTLSGGFSYWPGGDYDNPWGTNYAGHFMIEAKKAGYFVPNSMFSAWLKYQQNSARNWNSAVEYEIMHQAYRLYTLALAGYPDLASMNRLRNTHLPRTASSLLAASYAVAGHQRIGNELFNTARTQPLEETSSSHTFGSTIRNKSILLHTATVLKNKGAIGDLTESVANACRDSRLYSTQETAWMILALAPQYRNNNSNQVALEIHHGNKKIKETFTENTRSFTLQPVNQDMQEIQVKNTGSELLYITALSSTHLPAGTEKPEQNKIRLNVQYLNANGHVVSPDTLKQNDHVSIRTSIRNVTKNKINNIVLSIPIPTGWEIVNDRLTASKAEDTSTSNDFLFDYQDIKDSFVYTYFDLESNETAVFTVESIIAYHGSYFIPAIYAQAMYDYDCKALHPGQKLERRLKKNND